MLRKQETPVIYSSAWNREGINLYLLNASLLYSVLRMSCEQIPSLWHKRISGHNLVMKEGSSKNPISCYSLENMPSFAQLFFSSTLAWNRRCGFCTWSWTLTTLLISCAEVNIPFLNFLMCSMGIIVTPISQSYCWCLNERKYTKVLRTVLGTHWMLAHPAPSLGQPMLLILPSFYPPD